MKSLRHIGLAVVLSLGASQVIAMDVPAVKPGFFTKENAMQLWTSCKNGFSAGCNKVAAGYNKSVDFLKPYGTQALTWIKNHKKTSIAIAAGAAVLAAAGLAYKKGVFGWTKSKITGLFNKTTDAKNNQKQQPVVAGSSIRGGKAVSNLLGKTAIEPTVCDGGKIAVFQDGLGNPYDKDGKPLTFTF